MSDHFDMPDQEQPGEADDQKQREEHAYELATYILAHPAKHISLPLRVAHLSGIAISNPEIDLLLNEVELWLEQFDWQDESNS
jgi:hypothetical protein